MFGGESPDLAAMLLDHHKYVPLPTFDMWALGLLMLELMGGQISEDHAAMLTDPVYVAEAQQGLRNPLGLPGQRAHMDYLERHVTDRTSYVRKVRGYTHITFLQARV